MRGSLARALGLVAALWALGAAVPRPGDIARVYLHELPDDPNPDGLPSSTDVFLSSSVYASLLRVDARGDARPGLALTWNVMDLDPQGQRWVFRLDSLARFADGSPVTASHVVDSWEALLLSERSPYRWLLDPVEGAAAFGRGEAARVEGLVAAGATLEVRLHRPTPDLPWRLAHPALGVRSRAGAGGSLGAGPFRAVGAGEPIATNRFHSQGPPFLAGMNPVEPQAVDPSLLVESGQADLAILYGRSAGQLLGRELEELRLERLPRWDRIYALAWNSPVRDERGGGGMPPGLRDALGRGDMIRFLFDGRGDPAASLLPGAEPPAPGAGLPAQLGGNVPVAYDADDPFAMAIASRLKASWEVRGVSVTLDGVEAGVLWQRMQEDDYVAAVFLHHPPTEDPVLALWGTFARLGERAAPALQALEAAAALADGPARAGASREAEELLLRRGFLVPLVRLHAFLACDAALVGVETGAAGILRLEDAWWSAPRRVR